MVYKIFDYDGNGIHLDQKGMKQIFDSWKMLALLVQHDTCGEVDFGGTVLTQMVDETGLE